MILLSYENIIFMESYRFFKNLTKNENINTNTHDYFVEKFWNT